MEVKEIKDILERQLEDTGWAYKFWKKEKNFEFRNTGRAFDDEKVDMEIDKFLADLEEDGSFKPLLTGKFGILRKDGKLLKVNIDKEGEPEEDGKVIDEEEAVQLIKDSLQRVDNSVLPSNRAVIDPDEIIDIYTENVRGLKMVTINMKGNKSISLKDDGGLQFRAR